MRFGELVNQALKTASSGGSVGTAGTAGEGRPTAIEGGTAAVTGPGIIAGVALAGTMGMVEYRPGAVLNPVCTATAEVAASAAGG
eukprot:CAMPEP_0174372840 /NCGR_PEP_ID=MMETSP0811_2-20130205/104869_1 /TAXON_ID=73025 ORGANISM="Eutreptiella gymnastica-like, Strain CCMP1594" /NCGR_SAMPLE_ID=MMETSP0811_2 /ASSEMBLY_ACC=CAM_ASM_000667 /LENGTH=84 /DNA_ID=CAMNT_0015520579 /DNA_START=297 /DNA_END=552 /DNA_ORIENTATION=-